MPNSKGESTKTVTPRNPELNPQLPKGTPMEKTIERLRISEQERAKEDHDAGIAEGKEWAMEYAEARDLRFLARCDKRLGKRDWTFVLFQAAFKGHELTSIFGEDDDGELDEEKLTDEFVAGFVDGALDVWREVVRKL